MQNGLDKELEKQGLDISVMPTILIFTRRVTLQPEKIGRSIFLFLKDELKLLINREKSGIRKPVN